MHPFCFRRVHTHDARCVPRDFGQTAEATCSVGSQVARRAGVVDAVRAQSVLVSRAQPAVDRGEVNTEERGGSLLVPARLGEDPTQCRRDSTDAASTAHRSETASLGRIRRASDAVICRTSPDARVALAPSPSQRPAKPARHQAPLELILAVRTSSRWVQAVRWPVTSRKTTATSANSNRT
jgi:hypothetical protein